MCLLAKYISIYIASGLGFLPVVTTDCPLLLMASGHEPPSYTYVMNKVYHNVGDNGDYRAYIRFVFYHKTVGTGLSLATELK